MLAEKLRKTLLCEALIWGALFLWGLSAWQLTLFAALTLMLGGFFGIRAIVIGTSFALARGIAPSNQKIGLFDAAALVFKEFIANCLLFCFFLPFDRYWMGSDKLSGTHRLPVLLVHGYLCNRACWVRIARVLQRAGWPVATVNLEPPTASIEHFAEQLDRRVSEVLEETGAEQLILVAHSMGGLVARCYLARYGESSVRALITLGTPHHGTERARMGIGRCAREMEPGSSWLASLPNSVPVPLIAIHSTHDNVVMPHRLCLLPEAHNIGLSAMGHQQMLFSHRVARGLLRELDGLL